MLVYKPSEIRTLSSILSKPSLLYQCEKSYTPCGNGLSPVLDLQKRKWPEALFFLLPLPREWMARQTIQLHQPLASPSWLLPLNKRQPSGLQQFANSIMKESNQPFPTVAKNGRLSELSCLNKRPLSAKETTTVLIVATERQYTQETSMKTSDNGG